MAKITMHWDTPTGTAAGRAGLAKNVRELDDKLADKITNIFQFHEDYATNYAKLAAPWTDQTGNARAGLHATSAVGINKNHWELIVAHSMTYGIYLEVCNSGKYAIIMPTIQYIGPKILMMMEHVIDRLGAYEP